MSPPPSSGPPPNGGLLESWKQIAAYLQHDIRTVQRWEQTEGLPVHRHMHAERGTVYAYKSELTAWNDARGHELGHPGPSWALLARRWVAALTLLAVLIAGGIVWRDSRQHVSVLPKIPVAKSLRLFARATSERGRFVRIPIGLKTDRLVIAPGGSTLFALHADDRTISFIQTASEKLGERIALPGRPQVAAITPDGRSLYVATMEGQLHLIDVSGRRIAKSIPDGGAVSDMVVTPDGRKLFLAMGYAGLKRLTIATAELATLPGLVCPVHLALDPLGRRLYVSYQCGGPGGREGHDAIDILDTSSEASLGAMVGPPLVGGELAVSPDGNHIWADGRDACIAPEYDHAGCPQVPGRVVHVFRSTDRTVLESFGFPPPDTQGPIVFLPGGHRVAVLGIPIDIIDAAGEVPVESLNLGPATSLVPTPDGRRVYLALPSEKSVVRLDLASTACEPDPNGLAHFWPGDGNANDARDGMHGIVAGEVHFVPGRFGQAFSFEGGSVRFRKRSSASDLNAAETTLAGWVKFSGAQQQTILEFRSQKLDNGWRLVREPDGRLEYRLAPAATVTSSTAMVAGAWYHFTIVRTTTSVELYVNGQREATASVHADGIAESEPLLHMGSNDNPTQPWLMDEVVFYQRTLGPSEIQRLIAAPSVEGCDPVPPARF